MNKDHRLDRIVSNDPVTLQFINARYPDLKCDLLDPR